MLLILLKVIFCWCAIGIVTGINITYTNESFTTDGEPCITDCINNECMAEWYHFKRCDPGHTPALTYYTTRERYPQKWCKSRCGIFNAVVKLKWCYISDTEWDYCDDQREVKYIKNKALTYTKGPCMSNCRYYGKTYSWCYYDNECNWDYCEVERDNYVILSRTVYEADCNSVCGLTYGERPNRCVDVNMNWNHCAPPSRDFSSFRKMFQTFVSARNDRQCRGQKHQRGKGSQICEAGMCDGILESPYVAEFIESLEHSYNSLLTRDVNEAGNPVYRYTVMPPALNDDPILPLVVRARVTNETLRSSKADLIRSTNPDVLENMGRMEYKTGSRLEDFDEVQRLISYTFGGPDDTYNSVPQTQRLHRDEKSQWYRNREHVYDFVKKFNGWAEIVILVIYKDLPYTSRPAGFVVSTELYHPEDRLFDECKNKYYLN